MGLLYLYHTVMFSYQAETAYLCTLNICMSAAAAATYTNRTDTFQFAAELLDV